MSTIGNLTLASTILLSACAAGSLARAQHHGVTDPQRAPPAAAADLIAVQNGDAHMVVVKDKDVSGFIFKRLGLPNQHYCWEQCLQDDRCTGTRWGAIAGETPGQCELMSGVLKFGELRELKTEDGARIVVIASRKETGDTKGGGQSAF